MSTGRAPTTTGADVASRHDRDAAATGHPRRRLDRSPRSAVVINPAKVDDLQGVRATVELALSRAGWPPPRWLETTPEDSGYGQARAAVDEGATVVFVCGGDGTVRSALGALVGTDAAMAILPAGTGNLLAANLGLSTDLATGVEVALEGGLRQIDLGVVDGQYFAVMAGMGFDAQMIEATSDTAKARIGWPAYVLGAVRNLWGRPMRVTVRVDDGEPMRRRARSILVANGEPLMLIHGLGGTRRTWRHLIGPLARTHTVIAPDLPGHGDSDAPSGDYSLGAHAAALRDLLVALGYPAANVIGHSLGGGIAMQFAYQFPERASRLVLISSGGLGPHLTPVLRGATLPAASAAVAVLAKIPLSVTRRLLPAMSLIPGLIARSDTDAAADALRGLADARQRRTFIRTARTVIDWHGQTVSAARHLDTLGDLPVMLAWGSDDKTIPAHHQAAVAKRLPAFGTAEITGAGHFPHESAPDRLLPPIQAFLASTQPRPVQDFGRGGPRRDLDRGRAGPGGT